LETSVPCPTESISRSGGYPLNYWAKQHGKDMKKAEISEWNILDE
jgi:hypothetical protein